MISRGLVGAEDAEGSNWDFQRGTCLSKRRSKIGFSGIQVKGIEIGSLRKHKAASAIPIRHLLCCLNVGRLREGLEVKAKPEEQRPGFGVARKVTVVRLRDNANQ